MKVFQNIRALVGDSVTQDDLKYVDCYVCSNLGILYSD